MENLLSHTVVSGFITASGILIATSQLKSLLGVKAEGDTLPELIPSILPPLTLPDLSPAMLADLAIPALLISIIGFVESISVAQTLAAKGRQRIDPNQEFIGFGTANLGAATPAAGAFTAVGLALAAIALTPLIHHLPKAMLAATIVVAVLGLVDLGILKRSWRYSRADFLNHLNGKVFLTQFQAWQALRLTEA